MWFWSWFLRRVLQHKTAAQVETAFWTVVIVLVGIVVTAFLLQPSAPR